MNLLIKKSILFLFLFFFGGIYFLFQNDWVDVSVLFIEKRGTPSRVLYNDGSELTRFEFKNRIYLTYDKIPKVLKNAFIAAEDHAFYSHFGISIRGILRSLYTNIFSGRIIQGASTITQQLSRLIFLHHERTLSRKIKEIFVAFNLERVLTKEQILEAYLNNIYFGRGIYGVEAAVQCFWNISISDITIGQAATLAAVAKSAQFYSPLNSPAGALRRRNVILRSMYQLEYISQAEYMCEREKELSLVTMVGTEGIMQYVIEHIRQYIEERYDRDVLYEQGFLIQTTLDPNIQQQAQTAFCEKVSELREKFGNELNGALVSIEPTTGKILAYIGGYDYFDSQFNRAFVAVRQLGSSFKPILYAAAVQKEISLGTVYVDEPLSIESSNGATWEPKNWDGKFHGKMTLLKALTISNNIVAIKLLLDIGYGPVIDLARKCGLSRGLFMYPSLALGTVEASVVENVAAFNIFANYGVYVEPYYIESIRDQSGRKVFQHTHQQREVLSGIVVSKMQQALSYRMQQARGDKTDQEWFAADSIGKTGSTNGSVSNWFVGATPELTTAVYIGRDDGKGLGSNVYASQTAFPIWLSLYKRVPLRKRHFYIDPTLQQKSIDWDTGEGRDIGIEMLI